MDTFEKGKEKEKEKDKERYNELMAKKIGNRCVISARVQPYVLPESNGKIPFGFGFVHNVPSNEIISPRHIILTGYFGRTIAPELSNVGRTQMPGGKRKEQKTSQVSLQQHCMGFNK